MRTCNILALSTVSVLAAFQDIAQTKHQHSSLNRTEAANITPSAFGKAKIGVTRSTSILARQLSRDVKDCVAISAEEASQKKVSGGGSTGIFYRGDSRHPTDVFENGFKPQGDDTNLQHHLSFCGNSGLVSLSRSKNAALCYAMGRSSNSNQIGYVYVVGSEGVPSGYWVPGIYDSNKDQAVACNMEFAVIGTIPGSSISYAHEVTQDKSSGKKKVSKKKIKNPNYIRRSSPACSISKKREICDPTNWAKDEDDATSSSPPRFTLSMNAHELVYLVSGHYMDTPASIRREGGIAESQDANPSLDEAWSYNSAADKSGFTFVTRNINEARDNYFQSFQKGWVYRIAASPNMVPTVSSKGYTHAALGGVLWSQVQAYTPIDSTWRNATDFHWQDNLDYDPRWENYGASQSQPLLSGEGRPEGVSSRDLARQYMNELTGATNRLLNAKQRDNLRELLDWNTDHEPERDFPLLRHKQPLSLTSVVLGQFDWSIVDIPDHLRMVMKDGIPTSADCAQIIQKVIRTQSQNTSKPHRRNSDPNPKTKQDNDCEKLASAIKEQDKQANHAPTYNTTHYTPDAVRIVYHGDYLWPDEAKKQGGFLPASRPPGPKYSVEGMNPDPNVKIDFANFLIPTYLNFGAAAEQAARIASNKTKGHAGVVYVVHATPNVISSGNRSTVVGGILWSQVMGWMQVPQKYSPPEYNATIKRVKRQYFEKAFKETKDLFQRNEDYDRKKYIGYKTTTSIQQSLSTQDDLVPFMEQHGQAVGWQGTFPLFRASHATQSDESTKAKAKNAIPAPHEPSAWKKIENYVKSHAVAIALLPAAIAFNLIPGLGEVADSAELAALCTESVESVEMAEIKSSLTEVSSALAHVLREAAKLKFG